jgi:hypothetical protein
MDWRSGGLAGSRVMDCRGTVGTAGNGGERRAADGGREMAGLPEPRRRARRHADYDGGAAPSDSGVAAPNLAAERGGRGCDGGRPRLRRCADCDDVAALAVTAEMPRL